MPDPHRIGRRLTRAQGGGYLVSFDTVGQLAHAWLAERGYHRPAGWGTHHAPYPPV